MINRVLAPLLVWLLCLIAATSDAQFFTPPFLLQTHFSGYAHTRAIAINHSFVSTVSGTTLTNFPVLISGTYSYLTTVANGGFISHTTTLNGQTVPADLIYTSDSACSPSHELNWEVASYAASSGAIEVWVQVPTVSASANTTIYECYGNSSITTYQGNATSTWDSNYQAVYHFANGSTLSYSDSTSNGNTLTTPASAPTATVGEIDGGAAFSSPSGYFSAGSGITTSGITTTAEAWVKYTDATDQAFFFMLSNTASSGTVCDIPYGTFVLCSAQTSAASSKYSSVSLSAGTWYHIVAISTYTSSNNITNIYVNGTDVTLQATGGLYNGTGPAVTYLAGNSAQSAGNQRGALNGSMDEVRVSNTARSADWIVTEYNNQSSPSTFYTVGSQN